MRPGAPGAVQPAEKEEIKHSKIEVTQSDREVQFRLDLKLNQPAYQALSGALQVVMMGLRAEIDSADGADRRHELAAAGKKLGEQGLSSRGILPGHYPPGAFKRQGANQRSARDPAQRVSWMAGLLPYLGHQNLYGRIDFDKSWKDPANWLAARTIVPEFLDPSFPRRVRLAAAPSLPLEAAATHYVGLAGIGLDAAEYSASDPAVVNKLGVFGYDRAASLKEIREGRGLANTILLIRTPHDGPAGVTPWMAGGGSTVRTVPEKDSAEPFFSTESDGTRGTYVLMVDGSVRYIKKGISDAAFKAMVTVRGPAPEEFDLDKEAPKVEAPKKEETPAVKDEPPPPPPTPEQPKSPPPGENTRLYAPPGLGCSVMMPQGQVKTQTLNLPAPTGGQLKMEIHLLQQGQNVFSLSAIDAPASMGSGAKLLEQAKDQLQKEMPGAKVVRESNVTVDGNPGKDFTTDIPGIGLTRVRSVAVAQRIYQSQVIGPKEFVQSPEADRYLQSLKILPRAGGAAPNPGGAPPFPGGGAPNPGGLQPVQPNLGGGQPPPPIGAQPIPPNPGGGQPFPGKGQPFPGKMPPFPGGGGQQGGGPTISAVDLVRAYQANRANADKQYTGKTITVRGRVQGQEGNKIVLETGLPSILAGAGPGAQDVVDVYFQNPADLARAVRMGNVTVQGRCDGFNEILDVEIRNARLIDGANPGGGSPFPGKGPRR
jgi:hypothetical protein